MHSQEFSTEIGGKVLTARFSDLAEQAHGSVLLSYGNTVVLATAVMSDQKRDGIDYFPLSVEYEEKFYAAGAILGSRFMRREGRPSEEAVLSGRVVDRTLRPLFNQDMRNDVQVVITVLSIDEDDPDVLAVNAASLAVLTSDIPWNGPVSAVRIGRLKGSTDFLVNPTYNDRANAALEFDLLACGREDSINMIEVGAHEAEEKTLTDALECASGELKKLQQFQKDIAAAIGKQKRSIPSADVPAELTALFTTHIEARLPEAVFSGAGKTNIDALKSEWLERVAAELEISKGAAAQYYEKKVDEILHREALQNEKRADGRALDEVRPLFAQAGGLSPILHGSGIFYRGGTHVFSALTLGGPQDSLIIDGIEGDEMKKRFMHHYNFPPFSSGETGRVGGFNRRMIGHGALAEKALLPVLPDAKTFPYTIRLVSECMASNGSTSMASVCASTLALLDGGVPITRLVAGIAMGLMLGEDGGYKILTDIQGPEDHHGDMDFKVAGTREGVTAVQMDVKVDGVPIPILAEAFQKAKKARLHILEVIEKELPGPRSEISPRAPKIVTISVKPDQIGLVIGSGGKTINDIKERSAVEEIQIEEDGTIFITGKGDAPHTAAELIEALTHEYTAGEKFQGEVVKIVDFGAFVRINGRAEGLVHISEIAPFRVENVGKILSIGESVPVVVKEVDDRGRINLSIKSADPEFAQRKGIHPVEETIS